MSDRANGGSPPAKRLEAHVRFVSFPCARCWRRIEHRAFEREIPCRRCGHVNVTPVGAE